MFIAQAHYRSPPDFTDKALTDVEKGLERNYREKERLQEHARTSSKKKLIKTKLNEEEQQYLTAIQELQEEFEEAMDDDFNTPKAFAALFEFINKSNKFLENRPKINPDLCAHALEVLFKIGNVLTLFQPKVQQDTKEDQALIQKLQTILHSQIKSLRTFLHKIGDIDQSMNIDQMMKVFLEVREDARIRKDWKTADNIRKELEQLGLEIQDTAKGPTWRKK